MVCVVFDTSFLMNSLRAKLNPFREIRMQLGPFTPLVPSPVVRELEGLAKGVLEAKLALELLRRENYEPVESEATADRAVVELAGMRGCMLATTDRAVRQAASDRGIKLITLRQGRFIQLPD